MNRLALHCAAVDELDAAYALGALETDELTAVNDHLVTCRRGHPQLLEFVATAAALPGALEPVEPSPATRARLLESVAATPQEHRAPVGDAAPAVAPAAAARQPVDAPRARSGFFAWLQPRLAPAFAAAAVLAIVALGAWNLQLRASLGDREALVAQVAATIADSESAYRVTGPAGSGYVVEREDGSGVLILGEVAELASGERYQMWLLGGEEVLTAGSFTADNGELVVVTLDRPISDYDTFAVTVETAPVDAPTADPVMVAALDG